MFVEIDCVLFVAHLKASNGYACAKREEKKRIEKNTRANCSYDVYVQACLSSFIHCLTALLS